MRKLQFEFMSLVERCGHLMISEVNQQKYPLSLIKSLEQKGYLVIYKNKITSKAI